MSKQSEIFNQVIVIGLGLIGGSLALEIKAKGLARQVIGISRSLKNRREALRQKAVDSVYPKIGAFVSKADLIIIATPVESILFFLKELKPLLSARSLLTDVGSTKQKIVEEAKRLKIAQFVGGHPIAGTEKSGMQAAERGLFEKKNWILTPSGKKSFGKLKQLIKKVGARVLEMSAQDHDRAFAALSHLPNILSYALASTLLATQPKKNLRLAGSSLKEMTRLASSPPEMWRDISLANASEIGKVLTSLQNEIKKFQKAIQKKEGKKLTAFFEKGNQFRKELKKEFLT